MASGAVQVMVLTRVDHVGLGIRKESIEVIVVLDDAGTGISEKRTDSGLVSQMGSDRGVGTKPVMVRENSCGLGNDLEE